MNLKVAKKKVKTSSVDECPKPRYVLKVKFSNPILLRAFSVSLDHSNGT